MSKPKQYEIDSFEKLLNVVNEENVQNLCLDLGHWLIVYSRVVSNARRDHPKQTEGLSNFEICKSQFTWVDDGKTGLSGMKVVNNKTGEVKEKKYKLK